MSFYHDSISVTTLALFLFLSSVFLHSSISFLSQYKVFSFYSYSTPPKLDILIVAQFALHLLPTCTFQLDKARKLLQMSLENTVLSWEQNTNVWLLRDFSTVHRQYCCLVSEVYPEQLREVIKKPFAVLIWESFILFCFHYYFCTVLNDAVV